MLLSCQSHAQLEGTLSFAVVGDTQRTLPIEKLLLREQNDEERSLLMGDISRQKISFLIHVGDMVAKSTAKNWAYFDELVDPLKKNSIPIYPVLGNHDVYGNLEYAFTRFPDLRSHRWYTQSHHVIQMIWLDSNKSKFSRKKWSEQKDWFRKTLEQADKNPSIKAVIVFDHHPPFTNSRVTGDEKFIQNDFLSAYFESKKSLLWVNGHVHSYEHFTKNGKHFVTSGGGGGPRVKLFSEKKARHLDLFQLKAPRPFNYLLMSASSERLDVTVRALEKGATEVLPIDSFSLQYR